MEDSYKKKIYAILDKEGVTWEELFKVLIDLLYPNKWIPCSERLPKQSTYTEFEELLVTDDLGRIRHCIYLEDYGGSFVTVEEGMDVKAIAWQKAPEPYKEKGGNE